MAEPIYTRDNLRNLVQLSSLINSSLETPEDLPYLFDPFFSSKPDGTGMGLTKVYQVVNDHRGEIQIKSVPGLGTEVNIWLPRWLVK